MCIGFGGFGVDAVCVVMCCVDGCCAGGVLLAIRAEGSGSVVVLHWRCFSAGFSSCLFVLSSIGCVN